MPRNGSKSAMFLRMLLRAAMVQPGRAASALVAVIVAATVATAMMTIYVDVQSKLREEFRSYGANIVVVAPEGKPLPQNAMASVERVVNGKGIAVPFAYAVARTKDGQPIVVAGTDFDAVRKLNSWWKVTSSVYQGTPLAVPQDAKNHSASAAALPQALVGVKASKALGDQQTFTLTFNGKEHEVTTAGTVRTGAEEDSRVYLDLGDFEKWTGVSASTIEIGASGSPAEIDTTLRALSASLPNAEVRPVRQIVEGEARVLGKTRAALLAAIAIIIVTAILCVLATLTTWVLDRRRDFAIMKALGASEKLINGFFAAEAATMGAVGAIAGFALGVGVATWIGRANFHAAVQPRWSVLPVILIGSVAVSLISAVLPISMLRRVQPATILRGE